MRIDVYHHITQTLRVEHVFPEPLKVDVNVKAEPIQVTVKTEVPSGPALQLRGGEFMYIVKDTQPDTKFTLSGLVITDAEGQPLPDLNFTPKIVSDNPDAIAIIMDEPNPEAPKGSASGSIHVGAPGTANINVSAVLEDGTELPAPTGAQFFVTVGDPAAAGGGTLAFEGLTEAPPA